MRTLCASQGFSSDLQKVDTDLQNNVVGLLRAMLPGRAGRDCAWDPLSAGCYELGARMCASNRQEPARRNSYTPQIMLELAAQQGHTWEAPGSSRHQPVIKMMLPSVQDSISSLEARNP